jgi:hypothetical protein
MFKTTLANAWIKRSLRPKYANTQATPKSVFLDPAWSGVDIYPGMAMVKQAGQQVTLVAAATDRVYGLANFWEAPILGQKEITDQGINAASIWVLGPDAEFEVDSPAFDATLTWTDPGAVGQPTLISAYTSAAGAKQGQLCPAGTANSLTLPFARLLEVKSPTTIVIGGLNGTQG